MCDVERPVDRPSPWWSELPSLDERGRQAVLWCVLDILSYRDVTRADVRDAFATATGKPERPAL